MHHWYNYRYCAVAGKPPEPIPSHTYQSFVEECFKRMAKIGCQKVLGAKEYETVGIALDLKQKTETRMPFVKVLLIVGGYRLGKIAVKK